MSSHITLMGAEEVSRAASRISGAADEMLRAASLIDESVHRMVLAFEGAASRMESVAERIEHALAQKVSA